LIQRNLNFLFNAYNSVTSTTSVSTYKSKVMKTPTKITCFSRPSRGKGGKVGGVEVCRQGHALWLGDHFDLEQFNMYIKVKNKPMAARRSIRETKKAAKASASSSIPDSRFLVPGSAPSSTLSPRDSALSTSPGDSVLSSSRGVSALSSSPGDSASSSSQGDSASSSGQGDSASSSGHGDSAPTSGPVDTLPSPTPRPDDSTSCSRHCGSVTSSTPSQDDSAPSSSPGGSAPYSGSGGSGPSSSPGGSPPPSSPDKRILECSFRLILSSDDMDIDEFVSLDEAAGIDLDFTMADVSLNKEASLNKDITVDENCLFDGDVSLGEDTDGGEEDFVMDDSLNDEFVLLEEAVAIADCTTNDVMDGPQATAISKLLIENDANILLFRKDRRIVAHAKGGPRFLSAHARTLNSPPP
jgi:hypothetical protein